MEDIAGQMLGATLFLLGLGVSWVLWRRRGAASGLRGIAWSFLLLAAGLVGLIDALWQFATGIEVLDLVLWVGLGAGALAVVLYVVSGVMKARGVGTKGRAAKTAGGEKPQAESGARREQVESGAGGAKDGGDDFSDIEAILRDRGIT